MNTCRFEGIVVPEEIVVPFTSFTGKRLQKWIKNSLALADFFACDSSQTKLDLNQIIPFSNGRSEVIHLGVENQKQNFKNKNTTGGALCSRAQRFQGCDQNLGIYGRVRGSPVALRKKCWGMINDAVEAESLEERHPKHVAAVRVNLCWGLGFRV